MLIFLLWLFENGGMWNVFACVKRLLCESFVGEVLPFGWVDMCCEGDAERALLARVSAAL